MEIIDNLHPDNHWNEGDTIYLSWFYHEEDINASSVINFNITGGDVHATINFCDNEYDVDSCSLNLNECKKLLLLCEKDLRKMIRKFKSIKRSLEKHCETLIEEGFISPEIIIHNMLYSIALESFNHG